MTLSVSVLFQSLLTGYPVLSKSPVTPHAPKTVLPQPGGEVGPGKAAVSAANSLTKGSLKAAMANSSSSDSSDSDTDDNQVAANHKAGGSPLARLGICLALEQSCAGTGGWHWGQWALCPVCLCHGAPTWSSAAVCWLPWPQHSLHPQQPACAGCLQGSVPLPLPRCALTTVMNRSR